MRDEIAPLNILRPAPLQPQTSKPNSEISRRALVGGGLACAACSAVPHRANAFVPGLVEAIATLVTLWNAAKIVYDVYRYFAESAKVDKEITGFCQCRQVSVNSYYSFPNPRGIGGLGTEPGCDFMVDPIQRESRALCLGTPEGAVTLPSGCLLALEQAAKELRTGVSTDRAYEYTRPIGYIERPAPWKPLGRDRYKTEIRYHSARGTVGLRWLVTDERTRSCRGEYEIWRGERTIIKGVTQPFRY